MKVSEFFAVNKTCPICKAELSKEVEIDAMIDRTMPDDFILAGGIYYDFNGKKFIRNDNKISYTDKNERVIKAIRASFPKTFSFNTTFKLRVNRSQLAHNISPWFINTLDTRFFNACYSSFMSSNETLQPHSYHFISKYIIEGDPNDQVEIDLEILTIHDTTIYNTFHQGKHIKTEIENEGIYIIENKNFIVKKPTKETTIVTLAPIPIHKWNVTSPDTIKGQLEKYMILK